MRTHVTARRTIVCLTALSVS